MTDIYSLPWSHLADKEMSSAIYPNTISIIVTSYAIGIARGLTHLHSRDIIHGDLTPKNVLIHIDEDGKIMPEISDFGRAKILNVRGYTGSLNTTRRAHDIALSRQHKSISANDIFKALELIEFNHLTPILEEQFTAYRNLPKNEKGKKSNGASGSSSKATASSSSTSTTMSNGNPYPNISNRPSNPYPSITPDIPSSHDSPFTSEPLAVSSASARGPGPMDVDDDNQTD
ncbi:hypothetical protein AN958_02491 [Leucoagaricus sp. SymC.cos]|nr:hypothetical protein AN958_02491 [Leucoagaricus sp. SymC.cos]